MGNKLSAKEEKEFNDYTESHFRPHKHKKHNLGTGLSHIFLGTGKRKRKKKRKIKRHCVKSSKVKRHKKYRR